MNGYLADLSGFGMREIREVVELLNAWLVQGLPEDFEYEGIKIALNTHSGYVFLTNNEYQVAMMNGSRLERWYRCPCGHEGFREDMRHEPGGGGCIEFMRSIGIYEEEEEEE